MRAHLVILALAGALLSGCTSSDQRLGDLGSSVGGAVGKNTDTSGTNRRPDMNYAFTRPSLPTVLNR